MTEIDPEEMARLANRLAMLTTDSGEAENAGRAVGAMARKLGLTGGDLKQIFLDGLKGGSAPRLRPKPREDQAKSLSAQRDLRNRLDEAEARLREAVQERDALRYENHSLREALDRKKTSSQVLLILGLTTLSAVFIGTLVVFLAPRLRAGDAVRSDTIAANEGVFNRFAKVRSKGAGIRDVPDMASPVLATIQGGARLSVRRLLWNGLQQWAEVDVDGRNVYVLTTDVDLP